MVRALVLLAALACGPLALAEGVNVGKPSSVRNLVPAGALENQAAQEYEQLKRQASARRALGPDDHSQVKRLRAIATRMIPFVERFNPRARQWRWEVNLIGSKQINAFCMPGGKIAFYTGILDTLKLTDDEVAMVMGHEIAHALREHARERMAKSQITQLGASLLGELVGGGRYSGAFQVGGNLLSLKFSRDDESEARRGRARAGGPRRLRPARRHQPVAEDDGGQQQGTPWSSCRPTRPGITASGKSKSTCRK
jgi:Zn-dependent protease with chaperone function